MARTLQEAVDMLIVAQYLARQPGHYVFSPDQQALLDTFTSDSRWNTTAKNAPEAAAELLDGAEQEYGRLMNLHSRGEA